MSPSPFLPVPNKPYGHCNWTLITVFLLIYWRGLHTPAGPGVLGCGRLQRRPLGPKVTPAWTMGVKGDTGCKTGQAVTSGEHEIGADVDTLTSLY